MTILASYPFHRYFGGMATRQTQLVAGTDSLSCGAISRTRFVCSFSWRFMGRRWISCGTTGPSYGGVLVGLALNEVRRQLCKILWDPGRMGQCLARSCVGMMLYWLLWNLWSRGKRIRSVTKCYYTLNLDNLFSSFHEKRRDIAGSNKDLTPLQWTSGTMRDVSQTDVWYWGEIRLFLRVRDLFKPMVYFMLLIIKINCVHVFLLCNYPSIGQ